MIYFPSEKANAYDFGNAEIAKLDGVEALFVKVKWQEKSDEANDGKTVSSESKLLDKDVRQIYYARSKSIIIVADCYGNQHYWLGAKRVRADFLKECFKKMESRTNRNVRLAAKTLKKAKAAHKNGQRAKALKYVLRIFDSDVRGYKPTRDAFKLYNTILNEGRLELAEYILTEDVDGILNLYSEFKKTDLIKELNNALEEFEM